MGNLTRRVATVSRGRVADQTRASHAAPPAPPSIPQPLALTLNQLQAGAEAVAAWIQRGGDEAWELQQKKAKGKLAGMDPALGPSGSVYMATGDGGKSWLNVPADQIKKE